MNAVVALCTTRSGLVCKTWMAVQNEVNRIPAREDG